jgi:D-sedoheptulose 7-phosphate isomerase
VSADPLDRLVARYPVLHDCRPTLEAARDLLVGALGQGGRVFVCGNGGSAADAQHIAGELVKGMMRRRPLAASEQAALKALEPEALGPYLAEHLQEGLPVYALGGEVAALTAIANDQGDALIFAQQVQAYGRAGDVFWGLSTSGTARNVTLGAMTAKALGLRVLVMTGARETLLTRLADVAVRVPAVEVPAVQELHLPVYHAICEAIEAHFFPA